MQSIILKYLFLLNIMLIIADLQAQESIPATGGNYSGSEGSVSYSVGQVFYHTQTGINGTIAEGVQHSYDISIIQEITAISDIKLTVNIYPNPATDILNLEIDDFSEGELNYQLFSLDGKLLKHVKITSPKTTIDMKHLSPSTYIVRVAGDIQKLKSFKIVKK